jgi:hypothetical protein
MLQALASPALDRFVQGLEELGVLRLEGTDRIMNATDVNRGSSPAITRGHPLGIALPVAS